MRRVLTYLILLTALAAPLVAQQTGTFETVTFTNASTGFTATTYQPAGSPPMTICSGKLETAQIRFRYDGTAPTTTIGNLVDIGDVVVIQGLANLQAFRGIRTGSSSGVINFSCSRL